MNSNSITLQNRLSYSYLQRTVLRDEKSMFNEGLRLIEQAEYYIERGYREDAVLCAFEGLAWLYVSGITQSSTALLAVEHAAMLLERIHKTQYLDLRLSSEQKILFSLTVKKTLNGDSLDTAIDILSSASEVSGWCNP